MKCSFMSLIIEWDVHQRSRVNPIKALHPVVVKTIVGTFGKITQQTDSTLVICFFFMQLLCMQIEL